MCLREIMMMMRKQFVILYHSKKKSFLKVILSLGGWGGCKTCSEVFSTEEGRKEFAQSAKDLCEKYKTDGIDLDWEYPAIEGYPWSSIFTGRQTQFYFAYTSLKNNPWR
jgi:GH18 family chitinase